jgi:putative tricarboxylic transport membrane protein
MAILDLARRVGPFLVVFCAAMWLWTVAESFAISTRLGRAGPDLWPKIILLLMLGAALWGMAEALFKRLPEPDTSILIANATRAAGHEEDARQDLAAEAGDPADRRPIFAISGMAAMLGYVAAISYLGYVVSTFLLLLSIMLLAGYRRPLLAVLISLVGTLAFLFVFQRIVYISLPLGVGPFKELSLALMTLMGVR